MTFRFIHTADWQLGKPFANFPPDLAGELSAARFTAIERIAEIATQRGASHVLVAGDIFDSEDLANATLRRALERMAAFRQIAWILLPGNHDPARPGGVWDRILRFGLPENIALAVSAAPVAIAGAAVILPAPLSSKNPGRDPTLWMDTAATPGHSIRVGLAHGSVQGFGSDGESSVLIAKDRAKAAGLSYLALGDWHGATKINDATWYSGTPEPDRFPNNEPGFVLAVTLEDTGPAKVEKISTAQFHWARTTSIVASAADLNAVETGFAALPPPMNRSLVNLTLKGSLSLSEHAALDAWFETWSARLRHLDIDRSAVAVRPTSSDFDSLGASGPLVEAAQLLSAAAADPTHPDHTNAPLALQRLFGFAAEAARGASS